MSWLDTIPSAMQTAAGVAYLRLETYSGGTLSGYNDYPFIFACPATVLPSLTFGTPTHVPYNSTVASWGYLQGYSKATVQITASAGAYGSTIDASKTKITGNGQTLSGAGPTTTAYLVTAGTNVFIAEVTDTRGQKQTAIQTINVVAYAKPWFNAVRSERCDSDGVLQILGQYIKTYADFACTVIGANAATCTVKYRETGTTTWSSATTISNKTATKVAANDVLPTKLYDVLYTVADLVTTNTRDDYISKAEVTLNISPDGKSIGLLTMSGAAGTVMLPSLGNLIAYLTGLNTTVTGKLNSSAYTAADVLAKLLTVDTDAAGINATTLRGKAPSDFVLATKIVTGSLSLNITTAGTTVNGTINYSSAGFTSAPVVVCTVATTSPAYLSVSTGTPGTTSCLIYLYRSTGTGSNVISWIAYGT